MNSQKLWWRILWVLSFSAIAVTGQAGLSSVRYRLWTRQNPGDNSFVLLNDLSNLGNTPFNARQRTFFLIHGWFDTGLDPWIKAAKNNYLVASDCNVISVDWQQIASQDYITAAMDMYRVAKMTAFLIDYLVWMTALTTSMIHITGHSLGGQMAGMIGKFVTTGKINRVTGLDPAGPLFYTQPPNARIDKSDALFVDIIHTNSGTLQEDCLGLFLAVGHVDFYPNGGKHQPGCNPDDDLITTCSHDRSRELWVESILATPPNVFWSWPCSNYGTYLSGGCRSCGQGCLQMGFNVNRNLLGTYFLETNAMSPYAIGFQQYAQTVG